MGGVIDAPEPLCYNGVAKVNAGRFVFTSRLDYNYISSDMSKALLLCGRIPSRPFTLAMTGKTQRERFVMGKIVKCIECGQEKPMMAKGMCSTCYSRIWSRKHSKRGLTRAEYFAELKAKREKDSFGECSSCHNVGYLQSLGMCPRCYKKTVGKYVTCVRCGKVRKHEARGMCSSCYVNSTTSKKRKAIVCSICGEERPHHSHGICRRCYTKIHKKTWNRPIITCTMCGKQKPHNSRGLCDSCYWLVKGGRNYNQRRRSRKNDLLATLTNEEWQTILLVFDNSCAYCGLKGPMTQDHWIPLSRGGEYTVDNIVPACKRCNSRKHTMTGEEYLQFLENEKEYEAIHARVNAS